MNSKPDFTNMKSGFFIRMKYKGYIKWVLMVLGSIRFKMFGAFIGFFLGLFIEEVIENGWNSFSPSSPKRKKIVFTDYQRKLLILIASILNLYTTISQEKSYYILKYFYRQFGTKNGKALFNELKDYLVKDLDANQTARELKSVTDRNGKIQIITFLYGLTKVDRKIIPRERTVLENIAKNIGMAQAEFDRIVKKASKKKTYYDNFNKYQPTKSLYSVLGLKESATEKELKTAYRKLVLKFHPDKTTLDASIAAEKFQEVQEAYDKIKAMKGIK